MLSLRINCILSRTAVAVAALMVPAHLASAAPVNYSGAAIIVAEAPPTNDNGFLTDFLNEVPAIGDEITFSATFDPDTIIDDPLVGPGAVAGVEFYLGGITDISFTIGTTTLSLTPNIADRQSSLLVTTGDTDQLGVPFFRDGYALTLGTPVSDDPRWSVNLFFTGAAGGQPNLDPLAALPNPDDFEFVGFSFFSFRGPNAVGQLFDTFSALIPADNGGPIDPPPPPPPPTPVSEPGSLALLLGGLAVGAAARKRRTIIL